MSSVLFAMEWLPSYRLELFNELRDHLAPEGVEVNVVHGQPPSAKASSSTDASLPWATYRRNRTYNFAGIRVGVQPVVDLVRKHDVVIVQQASGLLLNLGLATGVVRPRRGWAMWGHGRHFNQSEVSRKTEALKEWETRRADHFFAYTETSRAEAVSIGVPTDQITVVNNTFPTSSSTEISPEIEKLATEIAQRTDHVGIIISSLDQWKRLPFLVEALESIKQDLPDFEFLVVGNGDHSGPLADLANRFSWVHILGAQFAADKARLASICRVTLHPGLLGLHIIDAFRLKCPIVTTTVDYHSHELDYLIPGTNGVIVGQSGTPADMAAQAVRILVEDEWRNHLVEGGLASAANLSLEASVHRFSIGIQKILE